MLQSLRQSFSSKLAALDGEIGHVRDYYFDDQNWAVRYVVADTGNWLTGRQVLLAPHGFNHLELGEKLLTVNLTRKQIEASPSIGTHQPLSRQYEMEYYRHYGWPNYWDGGGLWGLNTFPTLLPAAPAAPGGPAIAHDPPLVAADAHLRSAKAVNGYGIEASDGVAGHVCDFLMDSRTWVIEQLAVKTGHRLSGREVLIPVHLVEKISYDKSTIFIRMTRNLIEANPEYLASKPGTKPEPVPQFISPL